MRALKEGDFKEDPYVIEDLHSCDACEKNIDLVRYHCLNCRSLVLCEECHALQERYVHYLSVEEQSTIRREHKENHIFLRLFDYQDVSLK